MGIIRLLLAVAVFFGHSQPHWNMIGGDTAVQGFYLISGYYMSMILRGKYRTESYWLFLRNRFLRIYPAYAIVALISLVGAIIWQVGPLTGMPAIHGWTLLYVCFTNIFIFGQDLVAFLKDNDGILLFSTEHPLHNYLLVRVAWSLGVELWFYLLVPFLVHRSWKVIAPIMVASIALRYVFFINDMHVDPWSYRFFPTEIVFFLAGMLMQRQELGKSYWSWILSIALLFVGLPGLFLGFFALSLPRIFALTKHWKWDRFIGDLSYPVYLAHVPLMDWNKAMKWDLSQGMLFILLLAFAALIVVFIEHPIARWKQTV